MRAARAVSLRASDVMRLYGTTKNGKSKKGFGRRVVVVQLEIGKESVRVWYRGLAGMPSDRRVGDWEGFTDLRRGPEGILHAIEGVWEGELTPGSRGRIVEYNNRRYESPMGGVEEPAEERGAQMAATKSKGKTASRSSKSSGSGSGNGRATEAQLDKLSAQVVKMRDAQGKAWGDICEALDIQPSRARQLYNRGGGEPSGSRGKGAKTGAATKSTARGGKTAGKGKRRP